MRSLLGKPWVSDLHHVFSSAEQKALDGAEILSASLRIPHTVLPELGENDRSATGFLFPPAKFWEVVEEFFEHPERSVRGWERACDAQARIVAALGEALRIAPQGASIACVSHGGVGTLLLCHLKGAAISRSEEQPRPAPGSPPGSGGGYYLAFDAESRELRHGWRAIDA
jgi:broad specificity phosphatase PhoE